MRLLKDILICISTLILMAGIAPSPTFASESREGKEIFEKMCSACHTIGGGKKLGPDLIAVTARRDREWLIRIIVAPDRLLAEKDPIVIQLLEEFKILMPGLKLSVPEAAAVLDHINAGAQANVTTETKGFSGDPGMGRNLFTGIVSFKMGGTPCSACHHIAGIGGLGGGSLGPDLTRIYKDYGEEGIVSILAAPSSFPTMKPIYEDRLLTSEEQAHLKAFFKSVADKPAVHLTLPFIALGLGGLLVLMALSQGVWRRRLRAVRRPMVEGALKKEAA